jgi:hypothetical protein|uniref:Uncharacterized protein n=1 Tax=Arabidopsis thaliana TaxID=3702 RepID=Q8GY36_ARATH|nr:unknown protein [Arabidopsis thaliana]
MAVMRRSQPSLFALPLLHHLIDFYVKKEERRKQERRRWREDAFLFIFLLLFPF